MSLSKKSHHQNFILRRWIKSVGLQRITRLTFLLLLDDHMYVVVKNFSSILSSTEKKRKKDRRTNTTHAAADIYDGEIRRVVVNVIVIVERILENESRVASSARTIHATSGGASESFLGDEFYTRGRQKKK